MDDKQKKLEAKRKLLKMLKDRHPKIEREPTRSLADSDSDETEKEKFEREYAEFLENQKPKIKINKELKKK